MISHDFLFLMDKMFVIVLCFGFTVAIPTVVAKYYAYCY